MGAVTVVLLSALLTSTPASAQAPSAKSKAPEPDWLEYRTIAESQWDEAYAEVDSLGLIPPDATWLEAGEIVRKQRPDSALAAVAAATQSIHAAPGDAGRSEALSYLAYLHLRLGEPDVALNALRFANDMGSTTSDGVAFQRAVYDSLGMPGDAKRAALRYRMQTARHTPLLYIVAAIVLLLATSITLRLRRCRHEPHPSPV